MTDIEGLAEGSFVSINREGSCIVVIVGDGNGGLAQACALSIDSAALLCRAVSEVMRADEEN